MMQGTHAGSTTNVFAARVVENGKYMNNVCGSKRTQALTLDDKYLGLWLGVFPMETCH